MVRFGPRNIWVSPRPVAVYGCPFWGQKTGLNRTCEHYFHSLLKHGLLSAYPLLPSNLRHGFPLGHMPALTEPIVLPNNPSTYPYMHNIHNYLQKELSMGRMSGPFSCEETELILHGPFYSSLLIVSLQPQQWGMPDKIRICRHLSKGSKQHPSINLHI